MLPNMVSDRNRNEEAEEEIADLNAQLKTEFSRNVALKVKFVTLHT